MVRTIENRLDRVESFGRYSQNISPGVRVEVTPYSPRIDSGASSGNATPGLRPLTVTPIRSLDELHVARLVPEKILERAAPYLTVDGDGVINQRTASDTVLVAATGELRDEPSRLLLISRGWLGGHPTTCEIQAVYAIAGTRLVFSHWRERSL